MIYSEKTDSNKYIELKNETPSLLHFSGYFVAPSGVHILATWGQYNPTLHGDITTSVSPSNISSCLPRIKNIFL